MSKIFFSLFLDSSNVSSSSIYENDQDRRGPQNVISGSYFSFIGPFFQSKKEDYPWIQWKLPRKINITKVTLMSRDCSTFSQGVDCQVLRLIEIRAGDSPIEADFSGRILTNKLCGTFIGPGETGGEYTIECKEPILSDVITIQLKDDNSILQLNQIKIEKDNKGELRNTLFTI